VSGNLIIAAGLFDSPWTVAIFLLAGALINWLSKRRADNAGAPPSETDGDSSSGPAKPNWEERLRQMLEEKIQGQSAPTPPTAKPPPIIRRPPGRGADAVPPVIVAVERKATLPVGIEPGDGREFSVPAARRYELSSAAHAAQALQASQRLLRSKIKQPVLGNLRRPQTARQAFAASLVFGTPKGLEP
jgi:hypothetical protein